MPPETRSKPASSPSRWRIPAPASSRSGAAQSEAGPADWRVDGVILAPPGRWTLRLEILVSDFEKPILETEFELR